jgi:glutathione S-transferase
MMPPLLALLVIGRLGILGKPARAPVQRMLDVHLDWLETELASRDWFAGDDFTAADIMMSFPLEASRSRAGLGESRPNLMDWLERIHARPAYAAALARGGAYAYA